VVLGEDDQAAAKALTCRQAGARVTVVSAAPGAALRALLEAGGLAHEPRAYRTGDLAGAFLCYASLSDPAEIARVRDEARREGVLLNVVDVPEACDFYAGALVERGALQIAIGTGGRSPALAARLRERLSGEIGPEFETVVEILGGVRRLLRGRADRHEVLRALAGPELPTLLRAGDLGGVDRVLAAAAGEDCSLARLGIRPAAGG
jgi:siroheme synthase-like protein